MYHDMDGWWVVMLLFWAAVAVVVLVVVVRAMWAIDHHSERPIDIARRRYARGEITREEFDRIRQDLLK